MTTTEEALELLARAAFNRDADELRQHVQGILSHMASQPTREGRMWRRVPVNLLSRIEGALARKDEQIRTLVSERDELKYLNGYDDRENTMTSITETEEMPEWEEKLRHELADANDKLAQVLAKVDGYPEVRATAFAENPGLRRTYTLAAIVRKIILAQPDAEAKA